MEAAWAAMPDFFKANAAVLALFLATLALGTSVQHVVLDHLLLTAAAFFIVEGSIVLTLAYRNQDQSTRRHFEELDGDALTIEALICRFAVADDFPGTDRVYLEWFAPQLSVDDGEYCKLMDRGEFVRVVEARHSAGSQLSKIIAGYYSVWPLSKETFEGMADGSIRERDFKSAMILSPSDPNAFVLYVPEICASKRAWDIARSPLVADLARYIGHILIQNPQIAHVAAWPYTKQGRHYVERAKMKRLGASWRRKFFWADRDNVLTFPQTRRPFKAKWTITY
jgi:hypothetical protein